MSAALIALAVISGAAEASAQAQEPILPELQLQRFRPAPGPGDFLNVYGSAPLAHNEFHFGFFADIADGPLDVATVGSGSNVSGQQTVDSQTTLSLIAAYGLRDDFEFGILVPLTLFQDSDELRPILENDPSFSTDELTPAALNDTRITIKYRFLDVLERALGLAWILNVYVPLASNNALSSDGSLGIETRIAADKFLIEGYGLRLGGNFGYRYRSGEARLFRDALINDEVLWGAAAQIPLWFDRLDAIVELDGAIGIADRGGRDLRSSETDAELRGAVRWRLSDLWTLSAGLGFGFVDGVGTPDSRAFVGLGGQWVSGGQWGYDYDGDGIYGRRDQCPRDAEDFDGYEDFDGCPDPDNDADGIPDAQDECDNTPPGVEVGADGCPDDDFDGDGIPNQYDKCPEEAEDFDRFEDKDGCPDPDNDADGIPDLQDGCPMEAENYNGLLDEDGCPDDPNKKVIVSKDKLIITEPVFFATGKATILRSSYSILDDVAQVLEENANIRLVRVEGHTDDRGSDEFNQKLSQRRAKAVRDYLIGKGVARDRLEAAGFGESQPIAENETAEGRAKNRRVEFTIVDE